MQLLRSALKTLSVVVATFSLSANSVSELIMLEKSRPRRLHFGSSGNGTTLHLSGELFNKLAGVELVYVPYRGAPQPLTDLIAGEMSIMCALLPLVLSLVQTVIRPPTKGPASAQWRRVPLPDPSHGLPSCGRCAATSS